MNGGRLTVERVRRAWVDRARAYKVLVDGADVGRVRNGETETFDVPAGPHDVWMAIDWTRSAPVHVIVPDGGEVRVRCWGNATPWTVLWKMTVDRDHYLGLELVSA